MPPSLSSIIGSAVRAVWKHGLLGAWRQAKQNNLGAGFWDGGLLVAKLKTDGASLKGVDNVGNKYWEKMHDTQYGRHRWVEYASAWDYDAASVPPEWHGWLHHMTDHTPEQLEGLKPKRYGLESTEKAKYMAKGYALHPQRRVWKRYETWQPGETAWQLTTPVEAAPLQVSKDPKRVTLEPPVEEEPEPPAKGPLTA